MVCAKTIKLIHFYKRFYALEADVVSKFLDQP